MLLLWATAARKIYSMICNRGNFGIAIFLLCVVFSFPAAARDKEPNCNWSKGITKQRISVANNALYPIGNAQANNAVMKHLPFGMPQNASDRHGEKLLAQEHYIIWYDSDLRMPPWTAHMLTKKDVSMTRTRADSFRSDPRLSKNERSECADYVEPIFDQGHMVPNGDMTRSAVAMDDTFLMSNMTPQHCAFNRGVWQVLEQRIRAWAAEQNKIWIITGAIFDRKAPIGRDPDAVAWRMLERRGAGSQYPVHSTRS